MDGTLKAQMRKKTRNKFVKKKSEGIFVLKTYQRQITGQHLRVNEDNEQYYKQITQYSYFVLTEIGGSK